MDRLCVGEEIVVEFVLEVRHDNESNCSSTNGAGVLVLLQELGALQSLTTSGTIHPDHWLAFVFVS